mmetsp:Transcript_12212/g.23497  ORF Transcript_12212/g.23497 Transcript_12212/m.23497 type:complete len:83 (-) Transcript_12212:146-394(-)
MVEALKQHLQKDVMHIVIEYWNSDDPYEMLCKELSFGDSRDPDPSFERPYTYRAASRCRRCSLAANLWMRKHANCKAARECR